MSLALTQSKTALAVGLTASFLAAGGVAPFTYEVLPNGAGGDIDLYTGVYTAPPTLSEDPSKTFDTIQVTDGNLDTATAKILVGDPLLLFCEIIQKEMGLANGRVYLWDQKIMQPTDNDIFIVVSLLQEKIFGNSTEINSDGDAIQSCNVMAKLSVDIKSRGPGARIRKEEIVLALNSVYSEQQQEQNSFLIGKLPPGSQFVNLSQVDGAAIPYRYNVTVNMQYFVKKQKAVPYFDQFATPTIKVNA